MVIKAHWSGGLEDQVIGSRDSTPDWEARGERREERWTGRQADRQTGSHESHESKKSKKSKKSMIGRRRGPCSNGTACTAGTGTAGSICGGWSIQGRKAREIRIINYYCGCVTAYRYGNTEWYGIGHDAGNSITFSFLDWSTGHQMRHRHHQEGLALTQPLGPLLDESRAPVRYC